VVARVWAATFFIGQFKTSNKNLANPLAMLCLPPQTGTQHGSNRQNDLAIFPLSCCQNWR
jgi:hypothetical protein